MSRSVQARSDEQGFALVMALLFTGVVLLIVVSTAASTTLTSRRGGVDERGAYQALLTAEAGINAVPRRLGEYVRTSPYSGTTKANLQTWLNGAALTSYAVGSGTASMTLTASSATVFTVVSSGSLNGSKKVVAQDYKIVDRTPPPGMRPRAGITSRPAIDASGSPNITPEAANNATTPKSTVTTVSTAVTLAAANASTTVNVVDARGLRAGDYVVISNSTFRLDSISGNALAVTRVPTASASSISLNGNVDLILNAVAQGYTSVTAPMVIKISNATDLTLNEVVGIGTAKATVTAVNAYTKTATLSWVGTMPTTLIEGTAVTRDVTAMSSGGNVTIANSNNNTLNNYRGVVGGTLTNDCTTSGTGNSAVTTCRGANNAALNPNTTDSSTFTPLLFGMTDAELNEFVPVTTAVSNLVMNGQMLRINASDFSTVVTNGTSTGVLIVDGDINANINGNRTFNGFIYVRGCVTKLNGNLTLNGGIAIRGGTGCTSSVLGNLTINYNLATLRNTMMNATGSKQVVPVPQSWRTQ